MIIPSQRFGELKVSDSDLVSVPSGILGFLDLRRFCLVDPGEDTLILWLQSVEFPEIAFPVLEPRVFKTDYQVSLSSAELQELGIRHLNEAAVFTILTIPENISDMTANLKAPLVIHRRAQLARQVVLQEADYPIQYPIFKILRAHLLTIESNRPKGNTLSGSLGVDIIPISELPPCSSVHL